jgi:hypothetical protein
MAGVPENSAELRSRFQYSTAIAATSGQHSIPLLSKYLLIAGDIAKTKKYQYGSHDASFTYAPRITG